MKRSLAVLVAVFLIAGIVYAKGADTVSIKPKFKKKDPYKVKNEFILNLKKDKEDFDQSFVWNYELTPTDVKSGLLEEATIKTLEMEKYLKGVYQGDALGETPKESGEFAIENNLIKNFLDKVPKEKTPKIIYQLMIAITYVYLTKEKVEIGKEIEIPKEVIKGLQETLGFDYKDKLTYKMRVKEEIDKKKPVFGVEKGCVIETSLSWRNGDDGIECRSVAVFDAKKDLIAGLKSHGWIKNKSLNPENVCFTYKLNMHMDPPGTFEDASIPKPAKYPDAPKNEEKADTESGDLPTAFKVGEAAPDFTLEDYEGKKVSLSDFKGKVVMLHTWATTIDKIDDAMLKVYKGIYEKWSSEKLVIISLGIPYKEDTKEKQKAYIEKNEIKWTTLWDKDKSITSKYQLKNQFYVALVGADGKAVNWGYLGDKTKDAEMGQYLKEHCSK